MTGHPQTVGFLVKQRREALELTLAQLAGAVGATKGYLSMIENQKLANPPSSKLLEALERALDISDGTLCRAAQWQTTPKPVRDEFQQVAHDAAKARELARWLKSSTATKRGGARNLDRLFRSGQLAKRIEQVLGDADAQSDVGPAMTLQARVPLINKIAAGYPVGFTDLDYPLRVADEYVAIPDVDDPDAFAATVCGQSMTPDYREGDIIIFSPAAKVSDGCDCFVRLEPDHETTFKRVFFAEDGKTIRLQPLNSEFESTSLKREQVAGMYRAVARFSKL